MECPICYDEEVVSIFRNTCNHAWCKQCHQQLIHHQHTECPICRTEIALKRRPRPHNNYIEWLLEGGTPVIRWRNKRYRKSIIWRQ